MKREEKINLRMTGARTGLWIANKMRSIKGFILVVLLSAVLIVVVIVLMVAIASAIAWFIDLMANYATFLKKQPYKSAVSPLPAAVSIGLLVTFLSVTIRGIALSFPELSKPIEWDDVEEKLRRKLEEGLEDDPLPD